MQVTQPVGTIDFGRVPVTRSDTQDIDIEVTLELGDLAGNYTVQLVTAAADFAIVQVGGLAGNTSPPTAFPAPPGTVNITARLRFDAPLSAATYTGSMDINVRDAGNTTVATTTVTLSGQAVVLALVMVLDRSGSMSTPVGTDTRANRLRAACDACLGLMANTEKLGVVTFNHLAVDILPLNGLSTASVVMDGTTYATQRAAGEALFDLSPAHAALNPSGSTSIGGGVINAQTMISAETDQNILVLTDGHHNTPPAIPGLAGNEDIYAVGLGDASAVENGNLSLLTAGSGNYMLVTGDITGAQYTKLEKYFLQILFDVKNMDIVVDPQATLIPGGKNEWSFNITNADAGFDAIVLSDHPELLDFELVRPDKKVITPADANQLAHSSFTLSRRVAYFRFDRDTPDGTWKARVRLDKSIYAKGDRKPQPVTYAFLVAARSNLKFDAAVHSTGIHVGSNLLLSGSLKEFGRPVKGRAKVVARITDPDGSQATVELKEASPGKFSVSLPSFVPGLYQVHYFATGKALCGTLFTREAIRTVHLAPAGFVPSNDPGPIPKSEQVPGGATTQQSPTGQPGGTGGTGATGSGQPVPGSLDDLFARFPDLKKLLERCCGHDHHGHGHGHCHADCCCSCHRR